MVKLTPSGSFRWVPCPASAGKEAQFPRKESAAADEGTAAHKVAADVLHGKRLGDATDPVMARYAEAYKGEIKSRSERGVLCVEELAAPFHGDPLSNGYVDCWFVAGGELWVVDYKYGYRPVEARGNTQLLIYAARLIVNHKLPVQYVNRAIHQPRAAHPDGPWRDHRITVQALWFEWDKILRQAAEALGPNPKCNTGPHCGCCRALHTCYAASAAGSAVVDMSSKSVDYDRTPGELSVELAALQTAIKRASELQDALEAHMVAQMNSGTPIPGWAMERGRGSQAWSVPVETVATVGEMIGVPMTTQRPITPKQAIKAGADPAVVDSLSEHKPGKVKLVQDDGSKAQKIFGGK